MKKLLALLFATATLVATVAPTAQAGRKSVDDGGLEPPCICLPIEVA